MTFASRLLRRNCLWRICRVRGEDAMGSMKVDTREEEEEATTILLLSICIVHQLNESSFEKAMIIIWLVGWVAG